MVQFPPCIGGTLRYPSLSIMLRRVVLDVVGVFAWMIACGFIVIQVSDLFSH